MKAAKTATVFDDSRCLHAKNARGMTVGDYLFIPLGSTNDKGVTRLDWKYWIVKGNPKAGLFESFHTK